MHIFFGAIFWFTAAPALAAPTYLIADKMIDPATGSVIDSPALVIEDGKLKTVGDQASLAAPDGARIIDLKAWGPAGSNR